MDQRRIRRVIAAAALVMALAPQAHAAGRRIEPGLFDQARQWLTEVWSWAGVPQRAPAAPQGSRVEAKRSAGIDPMGAQIAAPTSPTTRTDGGKVTDPNG
jgi:hypothetical protein